jgi:hypothetical protein
VIQSPPTGSFPGQHKEYGKEEQDGVGAYQTCQQLVHIHKKAKESSNTGKHTQDQAHPNSSSPNATT